MKYLISLIILFLSCSNIWAQDFPTPMQPRRIVNDFTGMLNSRQTAALEQKLRNFNDTTSTQIAVVTVPSLQGYDPNDYAQRLAEKWGIGQKGKDNGILVLVKPKTQRERGQVAIAVGYGLEGVVPDAIASRIIRNEIIPQFQTENYYAGIDKATDVLMKLTAGEYTAEQYAHKKKSGGAAWILLPFLVVFLVPLLVRKRTGYTTGSRGSSVPPFFIGGLGGGNNFGSFRSGGGSFGGFGGGGFGGGGASGSW